MIAGGTDVIDRDGSIVIRGTCCGQLMKLVYLALEGHQFSLCLVGTTRNGILLSATLIRSSHTESILKAPHET